MPWRVSVGLVAAHRSRWDLTASGSFGRGPFRAASHAQQADHRRAAVVSALRQPWEATPAVPDIPETVIVPAGELSLVSVGQRDGVPSHRRKCSSRGTPGRPGTGTGHTHTLLARPHWVHVCDYGY